MIGIRKRGGGKVRLHRERERRKELEAKWTERYGGGRGRRILNVSGGRGGRGVCMLEVCSAKFLKWTWLII